MTSFTFVTVRSSLIYETVTPTLLMHGFETCRLIVKKNLLTDVLSFDSVHKNPEIGKFHNNFMHAKFSSLVTNIETKYFNTCITFRLKYGLVSWLRRKYDVICHNFQPSVFRPTLVPMMSQTNPNGVKPPSGLLFSAFECRFMVAFSQISNSAVKRNQSFCYSENKWQKFSFIREHATELTRRRQSNEIWIYSCTSDAELKLFSRAGVGRKIGPARSGFMVIISATAM